MKYCRHKTNSVVAGMAKLAFILGLFLVVSVNLDGIHAAKTCEGSASASGGTLDEMIGSVDGFVFFTLVEN